MDEATYKEKWTHSSTAHISTWVWCAWRHHWFLLLSGQVHYSTLKTGILDKFCVFTAVTIYISLNYITKCFRTRKRCLLHLLLSFTPCPVVQSKIENALLGGQGLLQKSWGKDWKSRSSWETPKEEQESQQ